MAFKASQVTAPKDINIILTGDIMLGRSVMTQSLKLGDPTYSFLKVAEKLKKADIVFSNLETPIIANCPPSDSGFKFCADPKMVEGLKFAGIDVVSLANNHTLNYGKDGLAETEKILTDNGIKWVGDNNLETIEENGTKFGFLGFDFVTVNPKDSDIKLISDSKNQVDILIVMVHWGTEYASEPTIYQKDMAKSLVGAGADVVTGAHPHWVQSTDFVEEKPVFYSLGNFIFDQPWSEQTKKGLAVGLTYQNSKIINIQNMPIYMSKFAQPDWTN